MKRLLPFVASAIVLAGCGSSVHYDASVHGLGQPVGPAKPPSPTALRYSNPSNREFARHDVQKLLRIVVVPPAARHVAAVPKSAPSWFREELSHGLPGAAVAHRTWVVNQPLKQVVRYVRTHARPRPRPEVPFRKPTNRIGSRPSQDYLFHPVPGRSSSRWLNVAMLTLPSGTTVVTAQAGDEWIHAPPRSVELPGRVRRIDITSHYGQDRPSVRLHVRNAYEVGSIVAWVNGLGVKPGHVFCLGGYFGGSVVRLTFRGADGTVLAHGTLSDLGGSGRSGPCNPLSLTVNGKKAPPLIGSDLLLRIQQHLDVDLAPPLPRDVSSCLRERGWKVRAVARGLAARKDGTRRTITFHATGKVTTTGRRQAAISRCLGSSPHIGYLG